jgi:hypothetical protein
LKTELVFRDVVDEIDLIVERESASQRWQLLYSWLWAFLSETLYQLWKCCSHRSLSHSSHLHFLSFNNGWLWLEKGPFFPSSLTRYQPTCQLSEPFLLGVDQRHAAAFLAWNNIWFDPHPKVLVAAERFLFMQLSPCDRYFIH